MKNIKLGKKNIIGICAGNLKCAKKMPTCGTIVPLRRAQKCPLMSNDISRFRSHDFLFRSHKRQMRSEKLLCCRAHGVTNIYIYCSSFASFAPHAL